MAIKGAYDPLKWEPQILNFWLNNKFYKPEYDPKANKLLTLEELKKDKTKTYCIIIPPPNAYGIPHMGNVSSYAYEDLYLRYYRMQGYKVYGQPGKDHAGIQGEIVVLREHFKPQGKDKSNMTREQFYKETYKFFTKNMKEATKIEQRIGLSADFDRNVFTLDPDIVKIVLETFMKLWEDGLVYKGVRIVNWCPSCKTALADIDTEKKERTTKFVYIKYPLLEKNQKVWELSFYNKQTISRLLDGTKTIETRALNPEEPHRYFKNIKPGDIIIAVDKNKESHKARYPFFVKRVAVYKNLKELYENENTAKISSKGIKVDFKTFEQNYNKLAPGYLDKINKNGIIAIELEPYNPNKHTKNFVTVATTRPETMLGDTAVVVNPTDKRYKKLIGQHVLLPLTWRKIPIVSDARVDKELGTGALKLTPAHAYEDYEIMLTWNANNPPERQIDYINVIDKQAKIVGPTGKYFGLNVNKAKEQTIKDLQEFNLIEKIEEKQQFVQVCERCKTIIEPQMSSQWFIKINSLKEPAISVVKQNKIKIHPTNMTKKYMHWMNNLRDWPISRSLWWGYRFPVWYKGKLEETINEDGKVVTKINGIVVKDIRDAVNKGLAKVSLTKPQGKDWIQDENVFDTWFSSGQWPYATLMKFNLFDKFYPTNLMETGYDILEFWVSRMIMLGLYRTGKIPFKDVYLHGLILAGDGQKMSKSKGNVIDPRDIFAEYGADVLRLAYLTGAKAGAGTIIDKRKLEGNKRFLNKIWNIGKFVLLAIKDVKNQIANWQLTDIEQYLTKDDKKMLDEIQNITNELEKAIKTFKFGPSITNLRNSIWHVFADWYIEQVKPRIYSTEQTQQAQNSRKAAQFVLFYTFKKYIKLLHPIIPFITEKIWQELPKTKQEHQSIMFNKW